jgi:hypothetical protein
VISLVAVVVVVVMVVAAGGGLGGEGGGLGGGEGGGDDGAGAGAGGLVSSPSIHNPSVDFSSMSGVRGFPSCSQSGVVVQSTPGATVRPSAATPKQMGGVFGIPDVLQCCATRG